MKETTITVTEAARNFADCVNRARTPHKLQDRAGSCTGRDLAAALAKTDLPAAEARDWHDELRSARKGLKTPTDKWR